MVKKINKVLEKHDIFSRGSFSLILLLFFLILTAGYLDTYFFQFITKNTLSWNMKTGSVIIAEIAVFAIGLFLIVKLIHNIKDFRMLRRIMKKNTKRIDFFLEVEGDEKKI